MKTHPCGIQRQGILSSGYEHIINEMWNANNLSSAGFVWVKLKSERSTEMQGELGLTWAQRGV